MLEFIIPCHDLFLQVRTATKPVIDDAGRRCLFRLAWPELAVELDPEIPAPLIPRTVAVAVSEAWRRLPTIRQEHPDMESELAERSRHNAEAALQLPVRRTVQRSVQRLT
jgi:hypothetical protein